MGKLQKHTLRDWMIEFNEKRSMQFCEPGSHAERQFYRKEHPTHITAMKCMDGRLNLPVITKTPPGIIQPYRNIGGRFDLGWPYLGILMQEELHYALDNGRRSMTIIAYHFSKGESHRGCAGFNYDTVAAQKAAFAFREQLFRAFVGNVPARVFYPIVVGIETDEDALVFHGDDPMATVNMAEQKAPTDSELISLLYSLYPNMHEQMLADLLPLAKGNLSRISDVRSSVRQADELEHREQVIMFGRGFDWFHEVNKAFIVGPYGTEDQRSSIITAATVILSNLRKGAIPADEGALLFTTGLYREQGIERGAAREKARYLARYAYDVISTEVPELLPYLDVLVGVVSSDTRKLEILETPEFGVSAV